MTLEIMGSIVLVVCVICSVPLGIAVRSLVLDERRRTRYEPDDAARLERIAVELSEISSRMTSEAARRGT